MQALNAIFDRSYLLEKAKNHPEWDIVVIGGGATGLGVALDAASRGFSTLLLERDDFAKGTSSRSTKLVHGGVRYLAQGDIGLVYEALHERGRLLENAPHLVKKQAFVIPCYGWWDQLKYLAGLKLYDWLSGRSSFGKSRRLAPSEVRKALPGIKSRNLKGGVEYFDGQFDDSRLAVSLAQTCVEHGGVVLNYFNVQGLMKDERGGLNGVVARDREEEKDYSFRAKAVINATGVFVDEILQLDDPGRKRLVKPSQGIHVVLDRAFLGGDKALMIPETRDGRVLFAVPWHEYALVGTTDTPVDEAAPEPCALEDEIEFVLSTAGAYLSRPPSRKDVLSIHAGLRPLAAPEKDTGNTKEISRSHKLIVSPTGMITITGGKWTTYRKMAEDTVDKAIEIAGLEKAACRTRDIRIHGYHKARPGAAEGEPQGPAARTVEPYGKISANQGNLSANQVENPLEVYGADAPVILGLAREYPQWRESLHPAFPYIKAQVIWAVRREMARTVEDVLARRLRMLFLDAGAALEAAPEVARLMAAELGKTSGWEAEQLNHFRQLAQTYLPEPLHTHNPFI